MFMALARSLSGPSKSVGMSGNGASGRTDIKPLLAAGIVFELVEKKINLKCILILGIFPKYSKYALFCWRNHHH